MVTRQCTVMYCSVLPTRGTELGVRNKRNTDLALVGTSPLHCDTYLNWEAKPRTRLYFII